MKFKRIMLLGIVVILMTGNLSTEAATAQSSTALEPWTIGVIDQVDYVDLGQYVSIDHYKYNGSAYISYYDRLHGDLKMAYEVSPGTGNCFNKNWECETVDNSTNDVGRYSSIDVFEATLIKSSGSIFHYAKIGISYYDNIANSLKYAQRTCRELFGGYVSCTWGITTVDDDPVLDWPHKIGQYTSLQFNATGTPVIYYHGESGTNLNIGYVKRATLTGSVTGECGDGWDCEVVARSDAGRAYGTHISADGNSVAFFDGPKYELILARPSGTATSNTCGMINNWNCVVVDTDAGRFVSLVDDGVHPARMVYYYAFGGTIKHAIASSGTGNCGDGYFSCNVVDSIGVAAGETVIGMSITLDAEGEPIIAYQDFSDAQGPPALKIARPYYVYDKPAGNCGDASIGIIKFWQCDFLGGGGSYLYPADYVSVSVSPAGLATIAYYERDDYYNLGRLKVAQEHKAAQQDLAVYLPLIIK